MKLLRAYLDGWRVLVRVLAFAMCLGFFAPPFALALRLYIRAGHGPVADILLALATVALLPLGAYLASWYSGEFRGKPVDTEASDELAGIDEL
jgi:hypothetical protein